MGDETLESPPNRSAAFRIRFAVEHQNFTRRNLSHIAHMPFRVLVRPVQQPTFDGNLGALFQVLTRNLRQRAPHDHVVPLGVLYTFTFTIAE